MNRVWVALALVVILGNQSPGSGQDHGLGQARPSCPVAFRLKYLAASELAWKLADRLGKDAEVSFSTESNTVYLRADANTVQKAKEFVKQRDVVPPRGVRIFQLQHAKTRDVVARAMAIVVLRVWLWGEDCDIPILVVSAHTNAIIFVATTAENDQRISELIRRLDWVAGCTN